MADIRQLAETSSWKEKADLGALMSYKAEALKAADELYYGEKVMESIRNAESIAEIARIMHTARDNM